MSLGYLLYLIQDKYYEIVASVWQIQVLLFGTLWGAFFFNVRLD